MSPARSTAGCPPAAEMVHATSSLLLLLLSLALLAPGHSARKCMLTGKWTNDLGSNMTIGAVNDRGEFSGSYLTAVADAPNNITWSPLLGIQNNTVRQPTFGFTVRWNFSGLATTTSLACTQCRMRMTSPVPHQQQRWSADTACDIAPNKALLQTLARTTSLRAALLVPVAPRRIPVPLPYLSPLPVPHPMAWQCQQ
uniref:Avidin n=1 Tax=Phasianus colchicus TaxID=9054 RepID=A0A669QB04_PHACC